MEDQPTCGKGLAHHSALPSAVGKLMESLADVLEYHMTALDSSNADAKRELDVYGELVTSHRAAAAQMAVIAKRMAGSRDLPMAAHDMGVLMSPSAAHVFERYVDRTDVAYELLGRMCQENRAMLTAMKESA